MAMIVVVVVVVAPKGIPRPPSVGAAEAHKRRPQGNTANQTSPTGRPAARCLLSALLLCGALLLCAGRGRGRPSSAA